MVMLTFKIFSSVLKCLVRMNFNGLQMMKSPLMTSSRNDIKTWALQHNIRFFLMSLILHYHATLFHSRTSTTTTSLLFRAYDSSNCLFLDTIQNRVSVTQWTTLVHNNRLFQGLSKCLSGTKIKLKSILVIFFWDNNNILFTVSYEMVSWPLWRGYFVD